MGQGCGECRGEPLSLNPAQGSGALLVQGLQPMNEASGPRQNETSQVPALQMGGDVRGASGLCGRARAILAPGSCLWELLHFHIVCVQCCGL